MASSWNLAATLFLLLFFSAINVENARGESGRSPLCLFMASDGSIYDLQVLTRVHMPYNFSQGPGDAYFINICANEPQGAKCSPNCSQLLLFQLFSSFYLLIILLLHSPQCAGRCFPNSPVCQMRERNTAVEYFSCGNLNTQQFLDYGLGAPNQGSFLNVLFLCAPTFTSISIRF